LTLPGNALLANDAEKPVTHYVFYHSFFRNIAMNNIVYIVGAIIIVLFILSFLGLR